MPRVVLDSDGPIDFVASESHYMDHLIPVYEEIKAMGRQGDFFADSSLVSHAAARGISIKPLHAVKQGTNPTVSASYKDLRNVYYSNSDRPLILSEHGCGLMAGAGNPSYAGGRGVRENVALFLSTNDYVHKANKKTYPDIPSKIIGCPKLDRTIERDETEKVIAFGFHWNCALYPETRTAFTYYQAAIREYVKTHPGVKVIGHAHPRAMDKLAPLFRLMGIEVVSSFDEVLRRTSVYINDCSSTMYEAAYYDIPIVVLNAPFYRQDVNLGIRFWDYADVGVQCNKPADLEGSIDEALLDSPKQKDLRKQAVKAVYPVRGNATQKSAAAIIEYMAGFPSKKIDNINGKSVGIVYVCFGDKARKEVLKSASSLRAIGYDYPITIIGDGPIPKYNFVPWNGQSPFDLSEPKGFRFRAGRIKPFIYDLSPYDYTLYIDADTEYMQDISDGFKALEFNDLVIAREKLSIGELYNKPRAGWEINIQERDLTIKETKIGRDASFLNSGVIFFRKSEKTKKVFCDWYSQWMRFQQWDEQLSLMRAIHANAPKVKELDVDWNHPHRDGENVIIWHNYGRGKARSNIA